MKNITRQGEKKIFFFKKRTLIGGNPIFRIKDPHIFKNQLEDAHQTIKLLRKHVDHQTTKTMFFKDRLFMVLAELQKRDTQIQKLNEHVEQLTKIIYCNCCVVCTNVQIIQCVNNLTL